MASNYYARQIPKIYPQGIYEESATQKLPLGTVWELADGRAFVYCKNASSGGPTIGTVAQTAAITSTSVGIAVAEAAAVGDDHVHITNGAGTAVANLFAEGYLNVDEVAGYGQLLKIKNHEALTSGGAATISLYDYVRVALTTSSKVSLIQHPYSNIIISPASAQTGVAIGVAPITPTASYYFWLQVRGPASVLVDTGDTLVVGTGVAVPGGSDAGAVIVEAAGTVTQRVGTALYVAAAAKYAVCMLNFPVLG